jgi:hypothetical protein
MEKKTKQQIPEALRLKLSEAGKKGWKAKVKKAKVANKVKTEND